MGVLRQRDGEHLDQAEGPAAPPAVVGIAAIWGFGCTRRAPSGVLDQRELPKTALCVQLGAQLDPADSWGLQVVEDAFLRPAVGIDEVCHDIDTVTGMVGDDLRVELVGRVLGHRPDESGSAQRRELDQDQFDSGLRPSDTAQVHPLVEVLAAQRLKLREEPVDLRNRCVRLANVRRLCCHCENFVVIFFFTKEDLSVKSSSKLTLNQP